MTKLRKFSYIRQLSSGKWRVYSEDGKNLGTYDSKSKAEERLKDVEMFKHMDKNSSKSLSLDGCVSLVNKLVDDFVLFTKGEEIPDSRIYKIASREEPISVSRSARMAGLKKVGFHQELKKNAFFMYDGSTVCQKKYGIDTRRIDQEHERVPRGNLQYWNRSQQFVDDIDYDKLNAFARLLEPLSEIKDKFGADPEYFESYARNLEDLVQRVCQVDKKDIETFQPQIAYLEQLLFARYRLSLEDIKKMGKKSLKDRILQKDENLLKRSKYKQITGLPKKEQEIVKTDTKGATQDSIVNAIFGNNEFRRDGEKTVERTITIKIKDEVID